MFIAKKHLCVLSIAMLFPITISSHAIAKEVYYGSCYERMQATEKEFGKPMEIKKEESEYVIQIYWSYPQHGFKKEFWWVKDKPNECNIDSVVIHGLGGNVYCRDSMKRVEGEKGKPEKVETSDFGTNGYIIWYYPFKGKKVEFNWNDEDGVCSTFEGETPFSKEGLVIEKARIKKEQERIKKERDDNIKSMKAKHPRWSAKVCRAIIDNKVFLGMTREQVIESWGEPSSKNVTIVASGRHEQWVYHGRYLYFDNNLLTGIQSSE